MKHTVAALAGILAVSFAPLSNAEVKMDTQAGMWEFQMETQMGGMAVPPQTFRRCITAQDIAQNKHLVTDKSGGKNPCTVSNMNFAGGKISYETVCKSEQSTIKATTTGSASQTSLELVTKMQMIPPQPGMSEMTQKTRAKRIGNC